MTNEELLEFPPSLIIKWRSFFDRQQQILYRRFEGVPIFLPDGVTTIDLLANELEKNRVAIDDAIASFTRSFVWPAMITPINSLLIRHRVVVAFEVMNLLSCGKLSRKAGMFQMMPRLDEKLALLRFLLLDCWRFFPGMNPALVKIAADDLDRLRPSRAGSVN